MRMSGTKSGWRPSGMTSAMRNTSASVTRPKIAAGTSGHRRWGRVTKTAAAPRGGGRDHDPRRGAHGERGQKERRDRVRRQTEPAGDQETGAEADEERRRYQVDVGTETRQIRGRERAAQREEEGRGRVGDPERRETGRDADGDQDRAA